MELANFDLSALPIDTPVVFMTLSENTLAKANQGVFYVELNRADDGLITIRNAGDKWTCLSFAGNRSHCCFAHPDGAAKFQPKRSPTGEIVFVESSTGCALEVDVHGQSHDLVCREKYLGKNQAWVVLQPCKLEPIEEAPTAADKLQQAVANEDVLAGRRQLIMDFIELGKTIEELKEILKILYGSTSANKASEAAKATGVERRQQALKLLDCGKPVDEVCQILTLMYGATSSEEKKNVYRHATRPSSANWAH